MHNKYIINPHFKNGRPNPPVAARKGFMAAYPPAPKVIVP